jgi:hypothetical protein
MTRARARRPPAGARSSSSSTVPSSTGRRPTHVGDVVERMRGRFYTGPDVGTRGGSRGRREQDELRHAPRCAGPGRARTRRARVSQARGGPATPRRQEDGRGGGFSGSRGVGRGVTRRILERGGRVVAAEIDPCAPSWRRRSSGSSSSIPRRSSSSPATSSLPARWGSSMTLRARLRCRIVAGGANNVLAKSVHGNVHERGSYAPDVVITSGAVIRGVLFHLQGRREPVAASASDRLDAHPRALEGRAAPRPRSPATRPRRPRARFTRTRP